MGDWMGRVLAWSFVLVSVLVVIGVFVYLGGKVNEEVKEGISVQFVSGTEYAPGQEGQVIVEARFLNGTSALNASLAGASLRLYDDMEVGTPAGNGWYVAQGSPTVAYASNNVYSGLQSLEVAGGGAKVYRNFSGSIANTTVEYWFYDPGGSFQYLGIGDGNPLGNGFWIARNTVVDPTYYIYSNEYLAMQGPLSVPLSVGWHNVKIYVGAGMSSINVTFDGTPVYYVSYGFSIQSNVGIYSVLGETETMDELMVYSGTVAPVISNATSACRISVWYPDKTVFLSDVLSTSGANGNEYINFTVPDDEGVYEYQAVCQLKNGKEGVASKSFHVTSEGIRAVMPK